MEEFDDSVDGYIDRNKLFPFISGQPEVILERTRVDFLNSTGIELNQEVMNVFYGAKGVTIKKALIADKEVMLTNLGKIAHDNVKHTFIELINEERAINKAKDVNDPTLKTQHQMVQDVVAKVRSKYSFKYFKKPY